MTQASEPPEFVTSSASSSLLRQRNIRLLYAYTFFWMFLILMPVLVPYYLQLGFSMQQIFLLQVAFGTCTLVLEVPSGYLADLWGRKNTLLVGAALYALGYVALFFARDFAGFLGVQLILGAAMSLASGTDLALLYAWINTQSVPERAASARVLANRQLAQVGSESLAALVGGTLVFWSFHHVLAAQMGVAVLPFVVALWLTEAPYTKLSSDHQANFRTVYRHIFKTDPFLKRLFFNQMIWSLSTFVAVWTFQKYWQELSIPLRWFGVLWALFNLTVGITGKRVHGWERRWGSHLLLHALALLSVLGFVLMAVALMLLQGVRAGVESGGLTGWLAAYPGTVSWSLVALGLGAGLCFQVSRGITGVLMREAFNWRLEDAFRATANSISSMAFRLGFALLGPLMGWLIDSQGLGLSLAIMGAIFGVAYVWAMLPLIRMIPEQIP